MIKRIKKSSQMFTLASSVKYLDDTAEIRMIINDKNNM